MNLHAAAEGRAPATSPRLPISWQDGFAALGPDFFTHLRPTPLPEPHWIATSTGTAKLLGLDPQWLASDEALQALTGNAVLPGSHPLASVYSGHQFGVWAGQLGDGRAILLGETASGHEIQLKGAGRTPYSRMGDGRAVLRSSIREFLCSEAMHALGIPTTRALSVTGSPAPFAAKRSRPPPWWRAWRPASYALATSSTLRRATRWRRCASWPTT